MLGVDLLTVVRRVGLDPTHPQVKLLVERHSRDLRGRIRETKSGLTDSEVEDIFEATAPVLLVGEIYSGFQEWLKEQEQLRKDREWDEPILGDEA